ncbi:MAG: hypothetical protein KDE27_13050 [Planctomycetes bacterium]|nr:hypothetical protein [Planctomycetota bacterium]
MFPQQPTHGSSNPICEMGPGTYGSAYGDDAVFAFWAFATLVGLSLILAIAAQQRNESIREARRRRRRSAP